MSDPSLLAKMQDPKGRLRRLMDSKKADKEILDELFLATLSRYPTDRDRKAFAGHLQTAGSRQAAFTDTLWALINTREFILNH